MRLLQWTGEGEQALAGHRLPRELGWTPGRTMVIGTFDTQITQGRMAGAEGK